MKPRPLLCSIFLACVVTAQDPLKDIKAKDPLVRLAAVEALRKAGDAEAGKALTAAIKDRDWEVREKVVEALAALKVSAATKALLDLCLAAETARQRGFAARALAAIDPGAAVQVLQKKAGGKTAIAACDALATIYVRAPREASAQKRLARLMIDKDRAVREAAARAWFAGAVDRKKALTKLLAQDATVACAALEMIRRAPRPSDLGLLTELLGGARHKDVVERRLAWAAVAACAAAAEPVPAADQLLGALDGAGHVLRRRAQLVPMLMRVGLVTVDAAVAALKPALGAADPGSRAAAAKALRAVGGASAGDLASARIGGERSARVRLQLLDTAVAIWGPDASKSLSFVADHLADGDAMVRERAAVLAGRSGKSEAVAALTRALGDASWGVAVCAAVSLGKTRTDAAAAPLVELAGHDDWRLRGAAVVGLMHLNRVESVAPLIAAVGDKVSLVARSAHEALRRIAYLEDAKPTAEFWRGFWKDRLDKYVFLDWNKIEENRKKYGYEKSDKEIYDGLDVVVLVSRGDHIEELLDKLQIEHRKTQASWVPDAALHPDAICVVNCTGEIEAVDVDPLSWFVRVGGSLFGSCWALNKTIELIYPGVVKKFETPMGEVLDNVRAYSCNSESTFLNGVFPELVRPVYHLEGAHLIDVVDPERVEVLIDSPDAAARHGCGNLAVWFRAGHGVIMDSANHFDLQGLEVAPGLKTPEQRQAYAIDHMGMSHARWREVRRENFWSSSARASNHVQDLSAFRFLTNFVRAKRIGSEQ